MQNILDKTMALLKTSLTEEIKTFYQGNPLNLGMSMLPLLYLEANGTDTQVGATGMDSVTHTITIGVIYDKRNDMGGVLNENVANRKMIEIMEGRNPDGSYLDSSVTGIIRKNFTLSQSVNNQILTLRYGLSKKGEVVYDEARITFKVSSLVQVNNRI